MAHEKTYSPAGPEAASAPTAGGMFGGADASRKELFRRNLGFFAASAASTAISAFLILATDDPSLSIAARWITYLGIALGIPLFWSALKALAYNPLHRKLTTEVFVTLALVAVVYVGQFWYAAWVVSVMWLGEVLMAWAGRHARSAMERLMALMPRQARVASADGFADVPIEGVQVGDVVEVRPGERLPVDGDIVRGETSVDQSMLTGESVPVDREAGEEVFAGTYNLVGTIQVRTQRPAAENTVSRIVNLMQQAQGEKVPLQRVVEKFLLVILPVVVLGAALTWFLTGSVERAATILLVVTPCAFSASTPLALISTIGNAARRGIIVKGGASLEALSHADVVLLDKTGTLTTSTPGFAGMEVADGVAEEDFLRIAAVAEKQSAHPLARAVVGAATARKLSVPDPDGFEVATGNGVRATWEGHVLSVGNERFMAREGFTIPESLSRRAASWEEDGHTIAYVARDHEVLGFLGFFAAARSNAVSVVEGLRRLGARRIVMITGDRPRAARATASRLGLEYRAEVTPEEKLDEVLRWKAEGNVVAMVGDGINDSSALAAADIGISMGEAGAEIAASASDIVIQTERFGAVLAAFRLAKRGVGTIRLNVFLATAFSLVGVPLAVLGVIGPGAAALFHAAAFIAVVINSTLVVGYNPREPRDEGNTSPNEKELPLRTTAYADRWGGGAVSNGAAEVGANGAARNGSLLSGGLTLTLASKRLETVNGDSPRFLRATAELVEPLDENESVHERARRANEEVLRPISRMLILNGLLRQRRTTEKTRS